MIRKSVHDVNDILRQTLFISKKNRFKSSLKTESGRECKVLINNELINMASDSYKVFFNNRKCVKCSIEGQLMAMEKGENDISYHFNMYGIDEFGHEVLMTKDHIVPKSKGGNNSLSNLQTMCVKCNNKKGNNI